jgi:F0F1-type ATP synthase membrane subunit c/vacuolar-type H+-ATPase subunit K
MGFGAIGAAIGEGYTAAQANLAVSRNTKLSGEVFKSMLVGQAIAESASIFALVIAVLMLFYKMPGVTMIKAASLFGAGLCMGLGAIGWSGMCRSFQAAGSREQADDQYADRFRRVSDSGHFFDGCCPDVDLYRLFKGPPFSHMGGFDWGGS